MKLQEYFVCKENKNNHFIQDLYLLRVSLQHAFMRIPQQMCVVLLKQDLAFWYRIICMTPIVWSKNIMEVNGNSNGIFECLQNILLCVQQNKVETTWGGVNDKFHFRVDYAFKKHKHSFMWKNTLRWLGYVNSCFGLSCHFAAVVCNLWSSH